MSITPEQLIRVIPDLFIRPDQRKSLSEEYYMRATIVLIVAITSSLFDLVLIAALSAYSGAEFAQYKPFATGIYVVVLLCYLAALISYKVWNSLILTSNLYALGVFLATTLPGFITGGFLQSPNLQIIVAVPVWAFLTAGNRYGIFWTIATGAALLAYFLAEANGIVFPQAISEERLALVKIVTWMVALSLVVICLFIYEINLVSMTTRLQREQEKLAHEASHDSLTGLLNRKLFRESVEEALVASREQGRKSAILYVDLDDFKPVNDGHGHAMGDEVLKIIASRLKSSLKSSDIVARLGGDEFGVVLRDVPNKDMLDKIARIILSAIEQNIVLDNACFQISASIGIAMIPADGNEIDKVISVADSAMYCAKEQKTRLCYSNGCA